MQSGYVVVQGNGYLVITVQTLVMRIVDGDAKSVESGRNIQAGRTASK